MMTTTQHLPKEQTPMTRTTSRPVHIDTFTSIWLGRKGTRDTYRTGRSATGRRVTVMVWADTPDVARVRLIEGDGRRDDFVIHREAEVAAHVADTIAREWITG